MQEKLRRAKRRRRRRGKRRRRRKNPLGRQHLSPAAKEEQEIEEPFESLEDLLRLGVQDLDEKKKTHPVKQINIKVGTLIVTSGR